MDPPIAYLIAVLKLSSKWEMKPGRDYAIKLLPEHHEFTPAIQLQLAGLYKIRSWVEPAFRALVEKPWEQTIFPEAAKIGDFAQFQVTQTKREIEYYLHCVAFHEPPVDHSWDCEHHGDCEQTWSGVWWNVFAKQLLHPDKVISELQETMAQLDKTETIPGMTDGCLRRTIESVFEHNPVDVVEAKIREAIDGLEEWLGCWICD
jgi:hypothetical protein